VRGADGALDLRRRAVGHARDDGGVGRVLHFEGGATLGEDPLAVDVHALEVCHEILQADGLATSPREPTPGDDGALDAPRQPVWRIRPAPRVRRERGVGYDARERYFTSQRAVRSRRPSRCRAPTSWTPSGRPLAPCMSGTLSAGIPQSVHSAQKAGSPVDS